MLLQTIAPVGSVGTGQDGRMRWFTRVRVVVRRTTRPRLGDIALLTHPQRPDALVVKRLTRRLADGWWVLGDNASASEDSRQFGSVGDDLVIGVLVFRYRPLRRSRNVKAWTSKERRPRR